MGLAILRLIYNQIISDTTTEAVGQGGKLDGGSRKKQGVVALECICLYKSIYRAKLENGLRTDVTCQRRIIATSYGTWHESKRLVLRTDICGQGEFPGPRILGG